MTLLLATWWAQEPAILQIRVMEGEGVVYPIGGRATRGVTVQVTDETGKPVEGASVSFRLPEDGPTGSFPTGAKTEIATTHADGRAAVWGMQWNRTVGRFEMRITAAKGEARAGTVCAQYLTAALASKDTDAGAAHIGGRHGHKWLWIGLAVAGAAGAGVGAMALGAKPSSSSAPAPTGVQIGSPTIGLGPR